MDKKWLFCVAFISALTFGADVFAQDGLHSADDDILAAMQALDEVGALLDDAVVKGDNVDVDALLAAANSETISYKVDDTPAADAKIDVKPASAKPETPAVAVKSEAPKHEIQTAPVKETVKNETAKTETAKVPETKPASAKPETPAVAAKSEAPKHEIQTAPVKEIVKNETAKTETAKVSESKPASAKPETPAVAANQNAKPETPAVAANQKTLAPDGTRVVASNGNAQVQVDPANAPHTLAMQYVMAIYLLNGVDLSRVKKPMPTIAELYQYAFSQKLVYQSTKPAIGDLAFFHNTTDRNRDGRWNDWHSLVGIVESIDQDGTISVLTYRKDKIEKILLNLKYPEVQKGRKGQVLNSQLRPDEGAQKGTSAKLFAGFANLLGDIPSVTVVDNWKPGMKLKK